MTSFYLESIRLRFRCPLDSDLPLIEKMLSDQSLTNHPNLPSRERVQIVSRSIMDHWNSHSFGSCIIESKTDGEVVGLGGLKEVQIEGKKVFDLGLMFYREHQRAGYGFESGEIFIHHAFHTLGLERIVANTTTNNLGALHLLEKWGFSPVTHQDSQMWELTRQSFDFRNDQTPASASFVPTDLS